MHHSQRISGHLHEQVLKLLRTNDTARERESVYNTEEPMGHENMDISIIVWCY